VGIGSAAAAIEPYLRREPGCAWTDVTYVKPGGLIERVPLPAHLTGTLRGFVQTGDALREGPFDALMFLTHNPAVMRQQAVAQTPTLLWTDVTPALLDMQAAQYGHRIDSFRALRTIKKALVRRTLHSAALCVGWSEWARRSFVQDYDVAEEKTAVVPPGIDLSRWNVPDRTAGRSLPRLLFVGGDFERKGGDLLLEVFRARLRHRAELDIVTRDPVPDEQGVTVHRGLTAGSAPLLALYRAATAFVLPTRGDCFSIASIEAMATGLPVVVSAVGGIPEIVQDGRTGYLVPPGDGLQLGEALAAILDSREAAEAMGMQGRKVVEEKFDAEKTAGRLLALLSTIARTNR
jgi:glycosyltransferase involved in cell wall biosynthesis